MPKTITDSLVIAQVKLEDIPEIHRNLNDPEVCRFLYIEYPVSLQGCVSYWTQRIQDPLFHAWGARTKPNGPLMGVVSLTQPPQRKVKHNASLSIVVGRAFWRKGVGSLLLQHSLHEARKLGIKRIGLDVRASHPKAIQLYEKHGFRICGRKNRYFKDNDRFVDNLEMESFL